MASIVVVMPTGISTRFARRRLRDGQGRIVALYKRGKMVKHCTLDARDG
jgi:hypothetical protein